MNPPRIFAAEPLPDDFFTGIPPFLILLICKFSSVFRQKFIHCTACLRRITLAEKKIFYSIFRLRDIHKIVASDALFDIRTELVRVYCLEMRIFLNDSVVVINICNDRHYAEHYCRLGLCLGVCEIIYKLCRSIGDV